MLTNDRATVGKAAQSDKAGKVWQGPDFRIFAFNPKYLRIYPRKSDFKAENLLKTIHSRKNAEIMTYGYGVEIEVLSKHHKEILMKICWIFSFA